MAGRPSTARSEISSAISDDVVSTRPPNPAIIQLPATSSTPVTQYGYSHLRNTPTPTNRQVISPPPLSTYSSGRPDSPSSQISRTHVPSITAQGFLRPMSSTKLQAQRLGRTSALGRSVYTQPAEEESDRDHTDDGRSVVSSRQGPYAPMPRGHKATPSATSYSESRAASDRYEMAQRDYHMNFMPQALPYRASSPSGRSQPNALRLNESLHVGSIRGTDILSPRSLRSGLSLGSRHVFEQGHQQLPSRGVDTQKQFPGSEKTRQGKNFEYFEGNTMFWMGGRLQNSRDRPINIASAVVIIVPTVLFFVFS